MDFWASPEAMIVAVGLPISLLLVFVAHRQAKRAAAPALVPAERAALPETRLERPLPRRARLAEALAKTREGFRRRLDEVLGHGGGHARVFEEIEEVLVAADVGIRTSGRILERVRGAGATEPSRVRGFLRDAIEGVLGDGSPPVQSRRPWVVLVAGVNGVGKTTSIAKLAARFRVEGKRVLIVAADTFRAAAIDQLAIWAERVGAELVRHQAGADPAAVAFDGAKAAVARDVDVVLVDTAGRLHTRQNLLEELRKVARVVGREIDGAPHEILLVIDATTGQNALAQARVFTEALGVTGIVLSKLDGTAKGGAALAIREELGVPIRYVGIGEAVDDLRPFSAREFAAALLGEDEEH